MRVEVGGRVCVWGGGGGRTRWVGINGVKREMLWSSRDHSLDSSC